MGDMVLTDNHTINVPTYHMSLWAKLKSVQVGENTIKTPIFKRD